MLAIAISLLFGFAAFAALVVIRASVMAGERRARRILVALAEFDRRAVVTRKEAHPPLARMVRSPMPAAA